MVSRLKGTYKSALRQMRAAEGCADVLQVQTPQVRAAGREMRQRHDQGPRPRTAPHIFWKRRLRNRRPPRIHALVHPYHDLISEPVSLISRPTRVQCHVAQFRMHRIVAKIWLCNLVYRSVLRIWQLFRRCLRALAIINSSSTP